jgi:glycerol-3-phosphate acyltransferase PlsY
VTVLAALLGVAIGSIPFAYLLVRWRTGRDVRAEGSGNVGALNSMRVARSRALGVAVLLLDAAKGAVATLGAGALLGGPEAALAAGVGAVAGHAYNPWLSLRRGRLSGGKGFATAAGALLCVAPWLVAAWLAVVALVYAALRAARGVRDEAPATLVGMVALVPAAALLYGGPVVAAAGALALLILPKLVRETRAALSPPTAA